MVNGMTLLTTGANEEFKNEKLKMKDEGAVYDLSGRKMANGKWLNGKWNGIYIKNGKKYVK